MSYDILALTQQLEADRHGRPPDLAWLTSSTQDPLPFWQDLVSALGMTGAPLPKSAPGERFTLYDDLVVRHQDQARTPAFRWYDRMRGFLALSYGELHTRATRKAGQWAAQKVAPGDVIVIVAHPGPDWLVAILAALRMGLCFSWLPPLGDRFLARRIKAAKAKHIATTPLYRPLLAEFEKLILDDELDAPAYPDRAHSYAPEEPCAMLFSPRQDPPSKPAPVTAAALFLSTARDALFAHRLMPGDVFAAPGFFALQHQPALALTALVAGGAYLELPESEALSDPALVTELPLKSVGITARVRDALRANPPPKTSSIRHWFRNLDEPFEHEPWRQFVEALGIEKTPASSLLMEPFSGGCLLQSIRRRGADWRAIPVPGQPFVLGDPVTGKPSSTGLLTFAALPTDKPKVPGHAMLSTNGAEFAYGGAPTPRRDGRVYPADEVVEVVETLPFCQGAFVFTQPTTSRALFSLCLFTGAETPEEHETRQATRIEALQRAIVKHLGEEFLPDRFELFPLYPRKKDGAVDLAWCDTQYRTGLLHRKARHPMFLALTALRKRCVIDINEERT